MRILQYITIDQPAEESRKRYTRIGYTSYHGGTMITFYVPESRLIVRENVRDDGPPTWQVSTEPLHN